MAYDHTHNILFLHIPKNAGKSIEVALGIATAREVRHYRFRNVISRAGTLLQRTFADTQARRRLFGTIDVALCSQHLTYQEIELLGLIPATKLDCAFTFAVVRNPFDRAVSTFNYFTPQSDDQHLQERFETFWHTWSEQPSSRHNLLAHRRCQLDFLRDASGRMVTDELLRFEHLEDDFAVIRGRFPHVAPLPHLGARQGPCGYREYYTATSRAIVEETFAKDLEAFSYAF